MMLEILKIILPPFIYLAFGFFLAIWMYRNNSTRRLKIVTKLFSLESEKFREIIKNDYNITKLELLDIDGKRVEKTYKLKEGKNRFSCIATYTDGSRKAFTPYWLCWSKDGRDGWSVFGHQKLGAVEVSRHPNHEKYTELSCWVFPPKKQESNNHIVHVSIGFQYE